MTKAERAYKLRLLQEDLEEEHRLQKKRQVDKEAELFYQKDQAMLD